MNHSYCNICAAPLSRALYESEGLQSLTSLCQLRFGVTRVSACAQCGHLQTEEIPDSAAFYENEYDILVSSEEEDQIYEVKSDGKQIYRTDHQVKVLLEKLTLPKEARILDYGCAKSSMVRRLLSQRSDLQAHLFDVSPRYLTFWEKFIEPGRWAIHNLPHNWEGYFDVVTSFFSMEHMVRPVESVRKMAAMLKPGGALYCIVPNVSTNIADFIVMDHVNHFSSTSIHYLLHSAGLEVDSIDADAHSGAFVVLAHRSEQSARATLPKEFTHNVEDWLKRFENIASFWSKAAENIRSQEAQLPKGAGIAIYGAGFYGAFVVSCLRDPNRVECHLDQNIYLQGQKLNGRPILPPTQLPEHIKYIWAGLNPAHAREIIQHVDALNLRPLTYLFLD